MRQTNLDAIIQSEVIQKEISRYHILMYVYGIQKDSVDEPICRAAMETQTWRIDLNGHKRREEGEGGTNGESSTETYTLPYVKQIANGNLLYDSRNSNQGSATTQSGGEEYGDFFLKKIQE